MTHGTEKDFRLNDHTMCNQTIAETAFAMVTSHCLLVESPDAMGKRMVDEPPFSHQK